MQEQQDMSQTQASPETWAEPASQEVEPAPATPPGGQPPAGTPRGRAVGLAALAGALAVGALAVGLAIGSGAIGGDDASTAAPAAERGTVPYSDDGSGLRAGRRAATSEAGWTSPDGRTTVRLDGRGGHGMGGGRGYGEITITKVDGTKLSLETENGWTRTIDAAGATVTEGGETVALSTLAVGDQIVFRETRNDDGTYTITAIVVVQPTVAGMVKAVDGSTVTVTDFDGATKKVVLTDATTYMLGRTSATKAAVVAGVRILAEGTLGSDGTLTASSVVVEPARAGGTVKEKSSSSITLTQRDGSTIVVKVTSATTYAVEGVASATLADIAVGAQVMASGTSNTDGSLTATSVQARAAGMDGGPGMGGGWGRGHGPGGDGFPGWGPGQDGSPDASPTPSGDGTNS